jgi:16S rRNA (guanine1207-N2)-methyltransferase
MKNAVKLAKINAEQKRRRRNQILQCDGFNNLNEKDFTMILSNPPYHTDFSVARKFIEKGSTGFASAGKWLW